MDLIVSIAITVKRTGALFTCCQGGMERTEIRSHDFGVRQQFIKVPTCYRNIGRASPFDQPIVCPQDSHVRIHQCYTLGHVPQHQAALGNSPQLADLGKLVPGDPYPIDRWLIQSINDSDRGIDEDHVFTLNLTRKRGWISHADQFS